MTEARRDVPQAKSYVERIAASVSAGACGLQTQQDSCLFATCIPKNMSELCLPTARKQKLTDTRILVEAGWNTNDCS